MDNEEYDPDLVRQYKYRIIKEGDIDTVLQECDALNAKNIVIEFGANLSPFAIKIAKHNRSSLFLSVDAMPYLSMATTKIIEFSQGHLPDNWFYYEGDITSINPSLLEDKSISAFIALFPNANFANTNILATYVNKLLLSNPEIYCLLVTENRVGLMKYLLRGNFRNNLFSTIEQSVTNLNIPYNIEQLSWDDYSAIYSETIYSQIFSRGDLGRSVHGVHILEINPQNKLKF